MATLQECLNQIGATDAQQLALVNDGYDLHSLHQFDGLDRLAIIYSVRDLPNWNGAKAGQLAGKIKPASVAPNIHIPAQVQQQSIIAQILEMPLKRWYYKQFKTTKQQWLLCWLILF
eukprot:UN12355